MMKKIILILCVAFAACKKQDSNSTNGDNLFTETKNNVQRNQPVLLSFGDNSSNQTTTWKCEPATAINANIVGDYSTYTFSNSGTYTVTATQNNKKGTFIINVVNSVYDDIGSNFCVTVDKQLDVNINDNVTFTVHNALGTVATSNWHVESIPSTFIGYSNNNNSITVQFSKAGANYVTFNNGTQKQTKMVWVNNATPTQKLMPFIYSDKLIIEPSLDSTSGSKELLFTIKTSYNYWCNTDEIIADAFSKNGNHILSFAGVASSSSCPTKDKPTVIAKFSNLAIGNTYPFNLNYENKTFEGSITVATNGTYTINNMKDNDYFVFTKLQLQRSIKN